MKSAGAAGWTGEVAEPAGLQPVQLAWLAGSIFIVSAGYGALLPVLPGWLASMMTGAGAGEIGRHVGFLSGVYAAGVLVGAPLWGILSDRVGRSRILFIGLVGYVVCLLLMSVPAMAGLWSIYVLRGATGFFVAAVVPVVAALVAAHTPRAKRARRFAWLSAMSLLGFLFGPALSTVANAVGPWVSDAEFSSALSARIVLILSALLGGLAILGLIGTLPTSRETDASVQSRDIKSAHGHPVALFCLSGTVMFVLAGFEIGIVLMGQPESGQWSREAAIMLAECSLVMLGVNALLFVTSALERIAARTLMSVGLILAMTGLILLTAEGADSMMYLGVSLTSAGTGLVLPVIAYLAAGAPQQKLGVVMGGLAASAGVGQTFGSAAGGWLFGALEHEGFGWLLLPLVVMLGVLFGRPRYWSAGNEESSRFNKQTAEPAGGKQMD